MRKSMKTDFRTFYLIILWPSEKYVFVLQSQTFWVRSIALCLLYRKASRNFTARYLSETEKSRILEKLSKNFHTNNDFFLSFCTGVFYNSERWTEHLRSFVERIFLYRMRCSRTLSYYFFQRKYQYTKKEEKLSCPKSSCQSLLRNKSTVRYERLKTWIPRLFCILYRLES